MTHVDESPSAVHQPKAGPATLKDVLGAYVGLTKPRVIELLLLTTVPVMFFADRGVPALGLVAATVVGGTLSAGSASTLNCVYDRDIDEQMRRTRRRALPRHIVSPRSALVFGLTLAVLSTVILARWVNPLSAGLALLANAFYVLVYTMVLGSFRLDGKLFWAVQRSAWGYERFEILEIADPEVKTIFTTQGGTCR